MARRAHGRIPRALDVAETNDAWRLIRYPDLVRDAAAVVADIHAWLGLPPAPPGRPVARASRLAACKTLASKPHS